MKHPLFILVLLLVISQTLFSQTPAAPGALTADDLVKKATEKIAGKDYEGAITDCNRALQITHQSSWAFDIRGLAKYYLGRYAEAIADYDEAIAIFPGYVGACFNRGLAKLYLNRYAEAIDDFTRAIAWDPKYFTAYNSRGYVYYKLGGTKENYRKAIADYDTGIALGGSSYKPFYQYRENANAALATAPGGE
ncbi:MAG: tetratricopeptide repeat protein [Sphingobacteriales bacterium]